MYSFLNEFMNPEEVLVPVSYSMGSREPVAGVCCSTGREEKETKISLSHPHPLQPPVWRSIYKGLDNGEEGTAGWEPESVDSSVLKIV